MVLGEHLLCYSCWHTATEVEMLSKPEVEVLNFGKHRVKNDHPKVMKFMLLSSYIE